MNTQFLLALKIRERPSYGSVSFNIGQLRDNCGACAYNVQQQPNGTSFSFYFVGKRGLMQMQEEYRISHMVDDVRHFIHNVAGY